MSVSAGCGQESGTRSPSTRRQQGGADRLRCQCHTHDKSRPSPGPNLCSRRPGPSCVQGHKYQTNITTHRIQARNTDHGSPIEKRQSDPPPMAASKGKYLFFIILNRAGVFGGPREAPLGPPWCYPGYPGNPGSPGDLRRTNHTETPRSLKEVSNEPRDSKGQGRSIVLNTAW